MLEHKRSKTRTTLHKSFEEKVHSIALQQLEMLKGFQRKKSTQWLSCICKAHAVKA
jgi:hypothetical protein